MSWVSPFTTNKAIDSLYTSLRSTPSFFASFLTSAHGSSSCERVGTHLSRRANRANFSPFFQLSTSKRTEFRAWVRPRGTHLSRRANRANFLFFLTSAGTRERERGRIREDGCSRERGREGAHLLPRGRDGSVREGIREREGAHLLPRGRISEGGYCREREGAHLLPRGRNREDGYSRERGSTFTPSGTD